MKNIGFAIGHAPNHISGFFGRLIEYLAQELGADFEIVPPNRYTGSIANLDGKYRLVMFGSRRAAAQLSKVAVYTKSFLVDHGILHTNRTPSCRVDFEAFSSPFLMNHYTKSGLNPLVQAWSSRYFLMDDIYNDTFHEDECLVYLTHKRGWKANSVQEIPFERNKTLSFLKQLSHRYSKVYVVDHINLPNKTLNSRCELLPSNIIPLQHGINFLEKINTVGSLYFEYSSVFSTALWNPKVKLFERLPQSPMGPTTPQARLLHTLSRIACYQIRNDDLFEAEEYSKKDPKRQNRETIKSMIFDQHPEDSYVRLLDVLLDALRLASKK